MILSVFLSCCLVTLTLCDPTDCSLPGSSVHGVLQARTLEWAAISFSRGSSRPRIKAGSPALQADSFLSELPGKPNEYRPPSESRLNQQFHHAEWGPWGICRNHLGALELKALFVLRLAQPAVGDSIWLSLKM